MSIPRKPHHKPLVRRGFTRKASLSTLKRAQHPSGWRKAGKLSEKARKPLRARVVSKAKTVAGASERAIRDECDELTRRIVLRDARCCFVCGQFNVELHPGHYITRKVLALRWDVKRAVRPQCNPCNAEHNERPEMYRLILVLDIGESAVREVERIGRANARLEYSDLLEIRDGLRRELESYQAEKRAA
jgi:hypothetical protein